MSANDPHDTHNPGDELIDELLPDAARDLVISRVIDGRASAQDWDRFRALASHEPTIWSELADTQSQHDGMYQELAGRISIADWVDLPIIHSDDTHMRQRLSLLSKWGGWSAAAALVMLWSLGTPSPPGSNEPSNTPLQIGSMIPLIGLGDAEPEQAFEQYMNAGQKSGRVIAEMPEQVVVETRPMPDGTIEVLYLRQIIERRVIDQAFRQVHDERGNTVAVPVRIQRNTRGAF